MKKILTKILFAALPFVFSGILAGAPLDGQLLENSRNAEQDLLRERILEQAKLEIRKSTIELNIPIEEHLGLNSDIVYISPAEENIHIADEKATESKFPSSTVILLAGIDNALRASVSVIRFFI